MIEPADVARDGMTSSWRATRQGLVATLAAAALSLGACASPAAPDESIIAIVGGAVVDPAGDGPPLRMDVIVSNERIVAIGANLSIPRGARRIEAAGKYLVPGLWDAHAHFNALTNIASAPELYVSYGVLSARDMGGDMQTLLALRNSIEAGERLGPNLFMAGSTLNGQQAAPFHRVVANAEEARAAILEFSSVGVDYIKVHRRISRDAFFAAIEEAHHHDLDLYGHVPLGVRWDEAAASGMASIEHIFTILENELSDPDNPAQSIDEALQRIDGVRGDTIFAAMAQAGTHLCPTLIAFERSIADPPELAQAKQEGFGHFLAYVRRAHRAGVPILAGSDVAIDPGPSLLRELELLVDAGLSPREALRSATTAPASLLRRPDLASISVGAQASFLILDADPTQDIGALRSLSLVLSRGRVIGREEIGRLRTLPRPSESAPG